MLFENQRALGLDKLKEYAAEVGLDTDSFDSCLDGGDKQLIVQSDLDEGTGYGVNSTPAFFINGRPLAGALPLEEFTKVIDDELARLGVDTP